METFLLVYNCFVFSLLVGCAVFCVTEQKKGAPLFFVLSVIQVLDIVRMIRG